MEQEETEEKKGASQEARLGKNFGFYRRPPGAYEIDGKAFLSSLPLTGAVNFFLKIFLRQLNHINFSKSKFFIKNNIPSEKCIFTLDDLWTSNIFYLCQLVEPLQLMISRPGML